MGQPPLLGFWYLPIHSRKRRGVEASAPTKYEGLSEDAVAEASDDAVGSLEQVRARGTDGRSPRMNKRASAKVLLLDAALQLGEAVEVGGARGLEPARDGQRSTDGKNEAVRLLHHIGEKVRAAVASGLRFPVTSFTPHSNVAHPSSHGGGAFPELRIRLKCHRGAPLDRPAKTVEALALR